MTTAVNDDPLLDDIEDQRHPKVICGECPGVYDDTDIRAHHGEDDKSTLHQLREADQSGTPGAAARRRPLAQFFKPPPLPPASGPSERGRARRRPPTIDPTRFLDWTFVCPNDHVVDGNPDSQFVLAVLGLTSASKSHFLAGIVQEIGRKKALRKIRVSLRDPRYLNPVLKNDVARIYVENKQLEPTTPGSLRGPFSQRLSIGDPDDPDVHSLVLFDIAGENLASLVDISENAGYVLLSDGIVILIDPKGFLNTAFDSGVLSASARDVADVATRESIGVIGTTLAETWKVKNSRALTVPICFVVGKADSVSWPSDFDWTAQTVDVLAAAEGADLRSGLTAASAAARQALREVGGELLVDDIEELFNSSYIRYAVASATSCMPVGEGDSGRWEAEPVAQGIALSTLQLLDLAGLLEPEPAPKVVIELENEIGLDGDILHGAHADG